MFFVDDNSKTVIHKRLNYSTTFKINNYDGVDVFYAC